LSDPVYIHFSSESLTALNICLAVIMFGVALDIKISHFTQLFNQKKAVFTGLFTQFLLLPLFTVILVSVLPISNGMALGMLLVAACPGGNVSNFFSQMARGHVALSVTLTAFSSLAAFIITPLNFLFCVSLVPSLAGELKSLELDFLTLMINMVSILLIPLLLGMWVSASYISFSKKISGPIRILSMMMLTAFIVIAVVNMLHNGSALFISFYLSKLLNNGDAVNRTVAIETGIQNSGLALILIFNYFDGNTAMAVVAAWWGVWHLISGFAFSAVMRKRPVVEMIQS